jgi:hypothetical protein
MAHGILAQSYMDLPGTPMFLAMTIRYLIVIFNPMANFDFECFRKEELRKGGTNNTYKSCSGTILRFKDYGWRSGTPIG